MPVDRRSARTKVALHHALASLMERKPYAEICVADIVARAGVGRSTFYEHFSSKDELLARGLERLLPLMEAGGQAQRLKPRIRSCSATLALFRDFGEHRELYRSLQGSRARIIVFDAIRTRFTGFVAGYAPVSARAGSAPRELVLTLLGNGLVSVLEWWLERQADLSPEEVDMMFHDLVDPAVPPGFFPSWVGSSRHELPRQET